MVLSRAVRHAGGMLSLALPCCLLLGCASGLADLPGPAAAALKRHANGAELGGFETEHAHGVALFEAGWREGGVRHEAKVTAEGDLVELEEAVPADAVPARVRAAAGKQLDAGTARFVRKTWIVYEVEGTVAGAAREVIFTPTGVKVDELDDDDAADDDRDDDDDEAR